MRRPGVGAPRGAGPIASAGQFELQAERLAGLDWAAVHRRGLEPPVAQRVALGESELDVIFYEGGTIDIGEAVAETLFLALDPYPRAPQAEEALRAAGVISEEEVRPGGALAGLKDLLGK